VGVSVAEETATPGAHWQREGLAASFAERRRILIPLLDVQEDVLRRLLVRHERPIARFLDIGCGAGAMSDLVLGSLPGSEAVLVDFSEPMLARALAALADHAGRWQAIRGDLNDPAWRDALPAGRYDAIVSGLAIHHLPPERKRTLFAELLALLEPGGMFVNMDYVAIDGPLRGLFDEEMLAAAVRDDRERGGTHSEHDLDLDDDVHFKWAEAAIYGGVRPKTTTSKDDRWIP
jgi:SAM-dependent methyltransferase